MTEQDLAGGAAIFGRRGSNFWPTAGIHESRRASRAALEEEFGVRILESGAMHRIVAALTGEQSRSAVAGRFTTLISELGTTFLAAAANAASGSWHLPHFSSPKPGSNQDKYYQQAVL